jgi:Txe/YoeB family toxin of Txe-Axe toxin-antitoxin module
VKPNGYTKEFRCKERIEQLTQILCLDPFTGIDNLELQQLTQQL